MILLLISTSNILIKRILEKELNERNIKEAVYDLITIIVTLPGIPLIWSIFHELGSKFNNFISFYIPLIITILMISALLIRIVKYIKK